MKRAVFVVPVVLFALLVLIMAMLLTDSERIANPARLPSPLVGKPLPEFDLPAVSASVPGGLSSHVIRGQVSVVNIFASWCGPCIIEHPSITQLARQGIPVYGISYRDDPVDTERWLRKHGNPYRAVGNDRNARASMEWGVTGVPETFLIDADGRVAHKHVGPIMPHMLEDEILPRLRKLLAK